MNFVLKRVCWTHIRNYYEAMSDTKTTKLTIRADRPTAITSSLKNANLDGMGFNVPFIALYNPRLAIEIIKLYAEARIIRESDPLAPDEDYDLYRHELADHMSESKFEHED